VLVRTSDGHRWLTLCDLEDNVDPKWQRMFLSESDARTAARKYMDDHRKAGLHTPQVTIVKLDDDGEIIGFVELGLWDMPSGQ